MMKSPVEPTREHVFIYTSIFMLLSINKNGEKSPLKHTVDVAPHSTRTIEFYANEPGHWQHHDPHLHDHTYWTGMLEAATNHGIAQFRLMPRNSGRHELALGRGAYVYGRQTGRWCAVAVLRKRSAT
jgi:hypothetical protein